MAANYDHPNTPRGIRFYKEGKPLTLSVDTEYKAYSIEEYLSKLEAQTPLPDGVVVNYQKVAYFGKESYMMKQGGKWRRGSRYEFSNHLP